MKNIISIIIAFASTLTISCKKDFIELEPVSTVSTDALYKTDKDFSDAITGVYSLLQDQYQDFWQYDLVSDDSKHQWPSEDIRLRLDNYTYQTNEGLFLDSWKHYYGIIFRVNTILEKIIDADATLVVKKDRYIAEAKFLRAFAYFDLVRIFGDVPMVTKVITDEEALKTPREKVEKIYDEMIIKDLVDAGKDLPLNYGSPDIGRATKGAAAALLGRVYLTKKDFVNAESKLKEVTGMGYALLPNYSDLFDYTKDEHHSEYIFDIEYQGGIQQGSPFTNDFFPSDPAAEEFYGVFHGAGDSNTPSDSLFDIFEPGDLRKNVTAARGFTDNNGNYVPLVGAVGAKSFTKKFITPIDLGGDSKVNWKVIRYADVLLMLAEAMNENNKTSEALTYLNMVRSRAGLPGYSNLTQDEARKKIYLERRLELSLEGQRWFDLVRTGLAYETLKSLGMKPYMVLFPIPLDEVRVVNDAKILGQNPGY